MNEHAHNYAPDCLGPTSLLLLQSVERCNLDCTCCYLPTRTQSGKMSLDTVAASVRWLRDSGLLGCELEVLWHAGEPLLAGLKFYESAHDVISKEIPSSTRWKHVFQTNGTLINDNWASFFAHVRAQIGISIDGPREWHDSRRRTWSGKDTFDQVIRSIEHLKRHNVPFSTISVLSAEALRDPERLYHFLRQIGAETFAFNDEEQEGIHTKSLQYESASARADIEHFYSVLYDLTAQEKALGRVRELSQALEAMHCFTRSASSDHQGSKIASEMNDPFQILNVAFDGTFSTFAPELMGHRVENLGNFVFGNVHTDSLSDVLNSSKFRQAYELIEAGVNQCRASCKYYGLCGGGSPANKYFENGKLDSTTTMFCQLSIMAPIDVVLMKLESQREAVSAEAGP